jgi:hypothetical protein
MKVAEQLSERRRLESHLRDELGLEEARLARPMQAALVSAASFASLAADLGVGARAGVLLRQTKRVSELVQEDGDLVRQLRIRRFRDRRDATRSRALARCA